MDFQMRPIRENGNEGAVSSGNGSSVAYRTADPTEEDPLVAVQITGNGETGHAAEYTSQENSSTSRIQRELNETVFWKVKLWMVFIIILVLIIAVIIISLGVCSAIHEDVDEKFDSSLFTVPLYFRGSFQLPYLVFTEELSILSSNKSQELTADLQAKMSDLYTSSPALGRYFSKAEIYALRNGSVIADYQLTFLMPKEEQDQLRDFTLSREMVYNVFRQFLYDQEPDSSGLRHIDPLSFNMFRRQ